MSSDLEARLGMTAAEAQARLREAGRIWAAAGPSLAQAFRSMQAGAVRVHEALLGLAQLIVEDPATWRPTSLRGWVAQAKAIVLHEFWMAAGEPHRSPGARWQRAKAAKPGVAWLAQGGTEEIRPTGDLSRSDHKHHRLRKDGRP